MMKSSTSERRSCIGGSSAVVLKNGTGIKGAPLVAGLSRSLLGASPAVQRPANKVRVAWLTNEIPPYRIPFYQQLADTPGWCFQVLTCVDREVERVWDVPKTFGFQVKKSLSISYLRHVHHSGPESFDDNRQVHIPVGLIADLVRFRPHVLISSCQGISTLVGGTYARLFGRHLIVSFEGTTHTESDISVSQNWLRRMIARTADAYVVDGEQGKQYIASLGVLEDRIVAIGQPVDCDSFSDRLDSAERTRLRNEFEVKGCCFLFCGRLVPLKGVDQLIDAWTAFSKSLRAEQATLLIVGDGPERARLEQRVRESGLTNVRFVGHIPRNRLPAIYQLADAFVFPSLMDCWALAVNEAMASGLPVINSQFAGSSEFIAEGETGWVINPYDRAACARALTSALEAQDRLPAMGRAAREAISEMDVATVAERIRRVVSRFASNGAVHRCEGARG